MTYSKHLLYKGENDYLQDNLDPAFERRFLYKIKFEKPDASVRARIWQQMIPELSESDAATLPDSVRSIGEEMCYLCKNVKSIKVPAGKGDYFKELLDDEELAKLVVEIR
jgi:SpoVK/Ycf46/Vps4 family AAA+-type ATPase